MEEISIRACPSSRAPSGMLYPIESWKDIPFYITRVFWLKEVDQTTVRGRHAHLTCDQCLIAIHGSCRIQAISEKGEETFCDLTSPQEGCVIRAGHWIQMDKFSLGTILMVLASETLENDILIDDKEEFLAREPSKFYYAVDLKAITKFFKPMIMPALNKAVDSGRMLYGPAVNQFQDSLAEWVGVPHCLGVGSGTAAIELALMGLKVGAGDSVITQANTCVATCMPIQRCGASTIFVDCDLEGMMDLDQLERTLKDHTNVKAIIVAHLFGTCPNMDRLLALCTRYKVPLIEDCAQAHGTCWKGQRVGSFGLVSCFSFYPAKNLGAWGNAGAVLTKDKDLYTYLVQLANLGSKEKYVHDYLGTNTRLDSIQAVVLNVKLPYLEEHNSKRRSLAQRYVEGLKGVRGVYILHANKVRPLVLHSYHLFVICVARDKRDEIIQKMKHRGVECIVHYPTPCHKTGAFESYNTSSFPLAEKLSSSMISLPVHPFLSLEDVDVIVENLKESLE